MESLHPPLRAFLVVLAAGLLVGGLLAGAPSSGAILDPTLIPKYVQPLVIPPAMPLTQANKKINQSLTVDYYEIAAKQFLQQVLPAPLPMTTVWGYGSATTAGTFNFPAFTIEGTVNKPIMVKWINGLVDGSGHYLPPLLPVDQTLHWANPPGGLAGRDMHGTDPTPYTGPVPLVTHVHGAHVGPESDGYPEAWFLPNANNIPFGYATQGTHYGQFDVGNTDPGTAVFVYTNDQPAAPLWYHDHAMGMTRVNVVSGLAGFWILRGGPTDLTGNELPKPAPAVGDPPGSKYYEIPVAIQDRTFNEDGSLFYPANREYFEGLDPGQLQNIVFPALGCNSQPSDVAPIWNPEWVGNTMVVNGRTWPVLQVEPRRYRFRFLNGCTTRPLILLLVDDPLVPRPTLPTMPFWQIGAEQSLLPAPVQLRQLIMDPAERADCIIDFTGLPVGKAIYLINEGPDGPMGAYPFIGPSGLRLPATDPGTTGQVMKFVVVPLASSDKSRKPSQLILPRFNALPRPTVFRRLSLVESHSANMFVKFDVLGNYVLDGSGDVKLFCDDPTAVPFMPTQVLLGTLSEAGRPIPKLWMDPVTEMPHRGDTEVWEIHNFTIDAHPIHLHLVHFQVIDRTPMGQPIGSLATRPPEPWETGFKDTVIAYPGEVTRLKATFDKLGLYVWHCHVVEHEDNEMMRPFIVKP